MNKLKQAYLELKQSIQMDVGYLVTSEGKDHLDAYVEVVLDHIAAYILYLICKLHGHLWVDCSSIGPESGDDAYSCERCGESHRTILY